MTKKSRSNRRPASRPGRGAQKTTNPGWFAKGQSGNLGGRPRRSSRGPNTSAFEILLDKTLTITKGDKVCEISMEEALQQRTLKDALAGKRMAMREVIKWIKTRAAWFAKLAPPFRQEILLKSSLDPDNADAALVLLGIVTRIPECAEFGDPARLLLEPWAVQLGLRRKRRTGLTEKDREAVMRCTRDAEALLRQHDMGR
jgi:hypothetical protein